MTAATADELLGSGKKEKPDQGGRAKEKSQKQENTSKPGSGKAGDESKKRPPPRQPRVSPPDCKSEPIKWPKGDALELRAARRALRDEWMSGAHNVFADDLISLRLLWPIFNDVHVDALQRCRLSNGQLAALVHKSISIVQRGLVRINNAGWIFFEETTAQDEKGKPNTVRKIGIAFPEGFDRTKKDRAGAAQANEMAAAGNAPNGASPARDGAGAAQPNAPQDLHSPLRNSPGDKPFFESPNQIEPYELSPREVSWVFENAFLNTLICEEWQRDESLTYEQADANGIKYIITTYALSVSPDEEPERAFALIPIREKEAWTKAILEERRRRYAPSDLDQDF
ncbi:hypothetical protein X753_21190 [Mesorhizobium sp. LNJC399B00]|uniref:hypothetical protein n=1 Tax=unclassified Mesorhizobium TaxID=325217 RepID=UPI0003CE7136|nr:MULTISPECIES: hypothetical protein [unclassified Mesorhizobium]ESY03878.1 hypothetical protein X753_21190 [Mesorhizobium sp. LNJC399B00]WJI68846.1 hypothetical protein NLY36_29415 [Mesorhizobium sp. C399B]